MFWEPNPGRQVLCVVERDREADERDAFAASLAASGVELVIEERRRERRCGRDRRASGGSGLAPGMAERRSIASADGRRVAERRVPVEPLAPAALPPALRTSPPSFGAVRFVARVEVPPVAAYPPKIMVLAERAKSGREQSFSELYEALFPAVYRQCFAAVWNPHDAEDLAQRVLIKVLDALPRQRFADAEHLRRWVSAITRNTAIDQLRRSRRVLEDPVEPASLDESPANADHLGELRLNGFDWISDPRLARELLRLPESQQRVLTLHHQVGLTTGEVALVLDITPNAVRQMKKRAERALRERLERVDARPAHLARNWSRTRIKPLPVLGGRRFALSP